MRIRPGVAMVLFLIQREMKRREARFAARERRVRVEERRRGQD